MKYIFVKIAGRDLGLGLGKIISLGFGLNLEVRGLDYIIAYY